MNKILKSILAGLCALVGVTTAGVATASMLPSTVENTTAQAETTYTTKDVAMMAYIDNVYAPNGNFYLIITMSEMDTTDKAEGVAVDTTNGDMPTILRNFDFYNKVKINGNTLAELGCEGVWENAFDVNSGSGAPLYKLRFHMHADPTTWQEAINTGKVVFGVGSNVTISEGALIPGYQYLTGDHSATVYRAGCDFVSSSSDAAYGIMSVGKTEVESVKYVQGHDGNNGYFGVSLKGDDYAGNGNTLEVNRNNYGSFEAMEDHFTKTITVNDEGDKTSAYGLFNLGGKGQGYYSFALYATEQETQEITIPAGTLFPAYAMTNLHTVNGNPVYMMYETQTDVTFYKQADGSYAKPLVEKATKVSSVFIDGSETDNFTFFSLSNHDYPESAGDYQGNAVSSVDFLANGNFYTHVLIDNVAVGSTGQAFINVWSKKGTFAIRTAAGVNAQEITILAGCQFPTYAALETGAREAWVTTEDITFVKNAEGVFVEKSQQDQTDLTEARAAALAEIKEYKDSLTEEYFDTQISALANIVSASEAELAADTTEEEIAATIVSAKDGMDAVLTKAEVIAAAKAELDAYKSEDGYFQAEQAEQRAQIVAQAKTTIDTAAAYSDVQSAVKNAKAAIDALMAASEVYTTKDVAMAGRVAGWYGNGNFTIAITLGAADWTNDDAGTKTYEGDLTALLNKLGFFDHIKLGEKTLAEWGCTACYDNGYELNVGEPDNIFLFHLAMGQENMNAASAAGIGGSTMATVLEGAIIPSYGYLTKTSSTVYYAGCDYESKSSNVAYGIESTAKTTVESVNYVQGHDGTCGYFGVSLKGDDYLADGTTIEVNQNYNYDNKYHNNILVNGEAGKVGAYGLFNLGEKGKGYFAFAIYVSEEDLVSITIPAGTKFPTRAMTTLREVNGNPVYIMYEVAETVILYKTENGYVSYVDKALEEVQNYKVGLFRDAEEGQRVEIVATAVAAIQAATDNVAIDTAVATAKSAIDALKTAAQYADEENAALVAAKNEAITEIEGYKANGNYLAEQAEARLAAVEAGAAAIREVVNVEDIAVIVAETKAAIDEIQTKEPIIATAKAEVEGYKADVVYAEKETAEKAEIIAEAKAVIDEATSQSAINQAVASAKAAINKLLTAAEAYVTTDVAMGARVAGWYGNGNFTIAITLGAADWTNDDAGVKEYNGDLSALFNKLGLFDHIKLGDKTLAEWGCVACYDNAYELNTGEPDYIFLLHLTMGQENMDAASAAGISGSTYPVIMEGAIIPSYGYLTNESNIVYRAGCDYEIKASSVAYGIEIIGKTTVESLKYVQGHDGTCGYFGVSLKGDDYYGDSTQLEVDQNYYFDSFVNTILVNGEAGKVGYYGLFNLGENGVGYYAFQMFVAKEDIVSITIPAGTKFPTRAMTTIRSVNNGNPVYMMYEVTETITLYKTENGYGTYAEYVLPQIENYKVGLFREAEEAQRVEIVATAVAAIQAATDNDAIDAAIASAKAAIDELKTAAQYADEELASVKAEAVAMVEGYKADVTYLEEDGAARAAAIETAKTAIAAAVSEEEIQAAVAAAQTAIDAISDKESVIAAAKAEVEAYKADVIYATEQAAARTAAIETAKTAIDSATTKAAIDEAVAAAKAAIDELKTQDELAAEVLQAKKTQANATVDGLKKDVDFDLYTEDAIETINGLYATVKAAIDAATTEAEVDSAVADFEAALAEVPQKDTQSSDTTSSDSGNADTSDSGDNKVVGMSCGGAVNGLAVGITMLGAAALTLIKKKEN